MGELEVLCDDDDDNANYNNGSQQGLEEFFSNLRSTRESMEGQVQQIELGDIMWQI